MIHAFFYPWNKAILIPHQYLSLKSIRKNRETSLIENNDLYRYKGYLVFWSIHGIDWGYPSCVVPAALWIQGIRIPWSLLDRTLGAGPFIGGWHIMRVSWRPSEKQNTQSLNAAQYMKCLIRTKADGIQ